MNEIDKIAQEIQDHFFECGARIKRDDWAFLQKLLTTYGEQMKEETAKAFGGCTSCYGKGYSTTAQYAESCEDFGGEETARWELCPYIPCPKCDRGKQFKKVLEQMREKGGNEAVDEIYKEIMRIAMSAYFEAQTLEYDEKYNYPRPSINVEKFGKTVLSALKKLSARNNDEV